MSKLTKIIAILLLLALNLFYCSSSEEVKEEQKTNTENSQDVATPTEETSSYEDIESGEDVSTRESSETTSEETVESSETTSEETVEPSESAEQPTTTEDMASVEETPKNEKEETETIYGTLNEEKLNSINERIQDLRYPDGKLIKGFGYKDTEIPNENDFSRWLGNSGKVIKEGFELLPPKYALEITGHADSTGPEQEDGEKKGNIFYSEKRAESVKNQLINMNIPENRIVTKGVGSSSPVPGIDERDALNRRVTFKFIRKESE